MRCSSDGLSPCVCKTIIWPYKITAKWDNAEIIYPVWEAVASLLAVTWNKSDQHKCILAMVCNMQAFRGQLEDVSARVAAGTFRLAEPELAALREICSREQNVASFAPGTFKSLLAKLGRGKDKLRTWAQTDDFFHKGTFLVAAECLRIWVLNALAAAEAA